MNSITDVDVESLLQALTKHRQNTAKAVQECLENCKTQKELCEATKVLDSSLQEKITLMKDLAKSEHDKYNILINTIESNEVILKQKENDLEQHKTILDKKQKKMENLESTRATLEAKLKVLQDGENLREMRDKILAYKVLTGVEFVYSTKRVMGTVAKKGQDPKAFSYNPTKSDEDICSKLWSMILED
ncbi:uncharacterized protein LOC126736068 [Anthonomus grandis grandis]|uniref:uncharacterized protein LOC126736068 n=1 Tax=Anthonomus grandis grandis TaxID=2921223 RepID=UPI0021651AA7|nr:uncharacterized protein LOC126736068 [Anthonomus grandis grandis]